MLACSLLSFPQQPRGVRFLRRQRVMVTGQLIPQGDRGGECWTIAVLQYVPSAVHGFHQPSATLVDASTHVCWRLRPQPYVQRLACLFNCISPPSFSLLQVYTHLFMFSLLSGHFVLPSERLSLMSSLHWHPPPHVL